MTFASSTFTAVQRFGLTMAMVLLTGCAVASHPVSVTSPRPPVVGSAPITAYDEYARVVFPPTADRTAIAATTSSPAESELVVIRSGESAASSDAANGTY